MRIYNYFAALLLSASLLVSCSKSSGIDDPVVPQEPETPTAKLPNITFGKPATKAMLNDTDLKEVGSKIHVYDIITGFTGTAVEGWDPDDPYIDEEIIYNGVDVWKYSSNGVYPWTASGTHKFFGYLTYDKKSNLNIPVTPTLSGSTLTVPEITFTPVSTQFDFLYSDAVERTAASKDYSVVPLVMRHLFTAISVEVESKTDVPVEVKLVDFAGLKNKNSATIAFASPTSTPTYGIASFGGRFFPDMTTTKVLNENAVYDPLTKQDNPDERTYFMLWPQTIDDVAPTNLQPNTDSVALGYTHLSTDSMIVVKYRMEIDGNWEEKFRTARMKFPKMAWEAGKKYHFTIQFSDKLIQLTTKVLPWDYNEYDVDYAAGTLVVPTGLKFDASTCSVSGNVATVVSGKNPVGTFTIMAPVGGTWMVGMTGDTEYFSISPTSGTIDPTGTSSGKVTLTVTPNLSLPRPADKQIKLKFTVTASGREIDAHSEINRDDWIILLPKN